MEVLNSIAAQSYSDIETILIIENSKEIYNAIQNIMLKNNWKNLSLVFNDTVSGLSANRNLAVKVAGGDIVAFVDDDAVLFPIGLRKW